jgi:peptidoglycan/LPS O-acetylase OafA/YrhL
VNRGAAERKRVRVDGRARRAAAEVARVPELDGLRGLAALAVLGYHAAGAWVPFGWAAVDVFFVLSGYLITSIILERGGTPGFLGRFYVRRGLRIWPIYYLTILGFILFHKMKWLPVGCRWSGLWLALTYTQNVPQYWGVHDAPFHPWLRHTWTLAIEEQFYVLWPVLVRLCGRRFLVPLALACLFGSNAARLAGVGPTLLLGRLDGLALGALLAAWPARGVGRVPPGARGAARRPAIVLAASVGLLIALGATGRLGQYQPTPWASLTLLLVNLGAFGLVGLTTAHAGSPWLAPVRSAIATYFGRISYGLYLYHPIVLGFSAGLVGLADHGRMSPMRQVVTVACCVGVSALSWALVERPILRLKRRFEYRRRGAPPPPARPRQRTRPHAR